MTRTALYFIGIFALLAGSLLLGLGIGKLFDKTCEGVLIGIGTGIFLAGVVSLRVHRRLLAFSKDKV